MFNFNELKRVWFLVMVIALIITAPNWLNAKNQAKSAYDAPWIYPGLNPTQ
jgi:hypothetical protein